MLLKYVQTSDLFLLRLFNNKIKCKILDWVMPIITYIGSLSFTAIYCIGALIHPNDSVHSLGKKLSLTLIFSTLISQIVKVSVNRIRPFLKIQNLNIKKIGIDKYSFPSGHTTAAFSMAISTALIFPSLLFSCLVLALLVGISRMYLGVHYPSDVAVGIFIGSSCSTLVYLFT
jgi:undecaprenyl-diphosphatase